MKSRTGRLLLVTVSNDESRPLPTFIEEDYDLRIESKGSDALRCLRDTSDVDLVLLYGSPSDISSLQLVRLIREQQPRQRLPLIMLARNATPEEVTLAFAHGADNCLTGPVPAELLKARVAALIEQKRGYEQVQAKSAALEETDGQRLQIFRMATHDVQSPLNNILLAEQILRRILPTERTEVEQSLNMIRDMAVNIGFTLTNYLGLLELRTGLLNYHLQPINLRDVIINVVNQHKFAATIKGIRLQVLSAQGWVSADAERVVQVLANLVSNAIKYSPYNSEVKIYTSHSKGFGIVTVEDQGPGIPPDERSKLFQEFGKLSTQPTGSESRTGLGLWIVKQLVEAQGGRVGAEFPESGGSRFWVALPTIDERSDAGASPQTRADPD